MSITTMIQRRLLRAAAAGLLMASLAGCEPAQQDRSTRTNTATTPQQLALAESLANITRSKTDSSADSKADSMTDERPLIACFGDSLTAGYGVDIDSSYPADLQHDLDNAGYHYRVVNLGISGETTKDGLNRVAQVIALKPAIVIVEFGGNDGLRGVPVASARTNLNAIVSKLLASGTKVALAGITLPPQYSAPYIADFNATYPALAKQYKIPLLPFVLQDVYGVPGSIQPDGIHPTAQGCIQVAKNILGLIKPFLKK